MKRILLTLLGLILVLGLFAATGYAGYRFGYAQGAQATANGDTSRPGFRAFDEVDPRGMPMHNFGMERGFQRGFGPDRFAMRGFGFFFPLMFLGRIAVLALIVWFVYWLFTRSGWRFVRTTPISETQLNPTETEVKG